MAQWYNMTQVNGSSMLTIVQDVQRYFFNPLGDVIILMIVIITMLTFQHFNNNYKINLMVSSFIGGILSMMMSFLGLVSDFTPYLMWGAFAISSAILVFTK